MNTTMVFKTIDHSHGSHIPFLLLRPGALYLYFTHAIVTNSIMAHNYAVYGGGAVYPDTALTLKLVGNQYYENYIDDLSDPHGSTGRAQDIAISPVEGRSSCSAGTYGNCTLTDGGVPSCKIDVCTECPGG